MFTGSVLLSNIVILHSGNTLEDIYRFLHQLIGIMYVGLQGSVSVTQAVIIEDLILKSSIFKCSKFLLYIRKVLS